MNNIQIDFYHKEKEFIPVYSTEGSSGADIKAYIPNENWIIDAWCRALIPTGLFVNIPKGYELQIRPRSGLAYRHGVFAVFGTIDSDYRGEIKVLLMNNSPVQFTVENGMRIAQFICSSVNQAEWKIVRKEELSETERGEGGFGSTGV